MGPRAALAIGVLSLAGLGGHGVRAAGSERPGPSAAGTTVSRDLAAVTPTSLGTDMTSTTVAPAPRAMATTPPATAPPATAPPATAPPATAPPATAPPPPPMTAEEALGREALGLLSFGLDDLEAYGPGWTVVFLPAKAGYRGLTLVDQRRVEIYVRLGETVRLLAQTVAHELGHVIDVTSSTEATRQAYMGIRGIAPGPAWFGCDGCADFATPAGDFAETVGLALSGPSYEWKSRLGPPPTAEQVAAVRVLYRW